MGSKLQKIALDYNPTKFPTDALLLRKDLSQVFFNSSSYDVPTYTNIGSGVSYNTFVADGITFNPLAGLSSEELTMLTTNTELVTNGRLDIIVDGVVIEGIVLGEVSTQRFYKPSSSLSIKSTATNDSTMFPADPTKVEDLTAQSTGMESMFIGKSGTKLYTAASGVDDKVYEYDLSVAYDPESSTFVRSLSTSSQHTDTYSGIWFSTSGDKLFTLADGEVYEYDLTTNWEIVGSFVDSFTTLAGVSSRSLTFKPDGTTYWVVNSADDHVWEYDCTAWDISTSSLVTTHHIESDTPAVINPAGALFNSDGKIFFVSDGSTDALLHYNLTLAYDLTTRGTSITGTILNRGIGGTAQLVDDNKLFFINSDDALRFDALFIGTAEVAVQ